MNTNNSIEDALRKPRIPKYPTTLAIEGQRVTLNPSVQTGTSEISFVIGSGDYNA